MNDLFSSCSSDLDSDTSMPFYDDNDNNNSIWLDKWDSSATSLLPTPSYCGEYPPHAHTFARLLLLKRTCSPVSHRGTMENALTSSFITNPVIALVIHIHTSDTSPLVFTTRFNDQFTINTPNQ